MNTLRIAAELPNGTALKSLTAKVSPPGSPPINASLPASLNFSGRGNYSVTAGARTGFSFVHWSSGGNSTTVIVPLNGNTSLVAFYKPLGTQTLHIVGKLLSGKSLVGVGVQVISGRQTPVTNITDSMPLNITSGSGQTYTVIAGSAAAVAFKYWNNNHTLTGNSFTTTIYGNSTITAYYQELPLRTPTSGSGNHTVTVIAHTMDGGLVIGAYFQVRINGVWNNVKDGYTPASVSVPDGQEELVMYHCAQVVNVCSDKFFVYRYYNNTAPVTLTRWQYFSLTSNMVFNSFYEVIPSSEAVHVTIEAVNSTGPIFVNCTCGSFVTIYNSAGTAIAQSLEPYSFWLWKGQSYSVTVGDLPGYTFTGWSTGATTYTIHFVAQPQGTNDPYYQYFAAIYAKKN